MNCGVHYKPIKKKKIDLMPDYFIKLKKTHIQFQVKIPESPWHGPNKPEETKTIPEETKTMYNLITSYMYYWVLKSSIETHKIKRVMINENVGTKIIKT